MAMLNKNLSVVNDQGAVTILKNKRQLNKLIVDSKGRPDTFAINLYWDEFRSWHNPKKEYKKGNVIYLQKLHKRGIRLCYRALSEKYGFSQETIRRKIVKLEKLGLLSRDFEISQNYSKVLYNQLVIYIWRQTPHFYNPLGVDRTEVKELKPSTNHQYISLKYGTSSTPHNEDMYTTNKLIGIHTHEDTNLLSTELREIEEEPLGYSSSISKKEKINKKKKGNFQSAEIVQISPTSFEETPQEKITEIPTLATGYPTERAKVYQTEETRSEATKSDTTSDRLVELTAVQDIPILANFLTSTENISSEEGSVKTEQINQITQLKADIFKAFDNKTSEEIMENCTFTELEPNKLGISIKADFSLNIGDKEKLKTCIRAVYGGDIQMVSTLSQNKQEITQAKAQKSLVRQTKTEWESMKHQIANYFPENQYSHVKNTWLNHLCYSHASQDKIVVVGRGFYVDYIANKFAIAIEFAVNQTKKSLIFQYEGNAQRPIEFKYKR